MGIGEDGATYVLYKYWEHLFISAHGDRGGWGNLVFTCTNIGELSLLSVTSTTRVAIALREFREPLSSATTVNY